MSTRERVEQNGHVPDIQEEVARRLRAAGAETAVPADGDLDLPDETIEPRPQTAVPRHPDDPAGAIEDAAREVCDPEEIRARAVRAGRSAYALPRAIYAVLHRAALRATAGVRKGAVRASARWATQEPRTIVASTPKDVNAIRADGAADGEKADRLQQEHLPKLEADVTKAEERVAGGREEVDRTRGDVARELAGVESNRRSPELLARVAMPVGVGVAAGAVDLAVTTVVLQPAVSDVIPTSELGTYLISAGISLALLAGSAGAGLLLAALRLRARIISPALLLVFAALMAKLIHGLDLLRQGLPTGVETLTSATLACCFVAMLVAYATAVREDRDAERKEQREAGTPLGNALVAQERAEAELNAAEAELRAAIAACEALIAAIEELRDSAARVDATVGRRESAGIAANVEVRTIDEVAEIQCAQEDDAHLGWAYSLALLEHAKVRAEEVPEVATSTAEEVSPAPAATDVRHTRLPALLAAGVLLAGAIAGPLTAPWVLSGCAALAAVLLATSRWPKAPRTRADAAPTAEHHGPSPVAPTADEDNPHYRRQPTHMVSRYRDGGPTPGMKQ